MSIAGSTLAIRCSGTCKSAVASDHSASSLDGARDRFGGVMAERAVHVVAEDLLISGAAVDRHAMDLHEMHTLADSCIDSALPYLPGLAAAALATKSAEWQATTTALTQGLTDHATALRVSAMDYVESDEASAELLGNVAVKFHASRSA
jgi:hypothetical protein